ncbi:MAG: excinuclease ABC subunit UvrC [Planctomycetota bacterium]|nr:MAG: excinuclease ABC subunit UvrC [Planctomycetota bacterium]
MDVCGSGHMERIKEILPRLPDLPGIYIFKDAEGRAIYIGKAASLKSRVASYFRSGRKDAKTEALLSNAVSLDYTVTDSEIEALILEADLIKKFKPRYNVELKDDKSFPVVAVTREAYPAVLVTRDRALDADYFGPFPEAKELRRAIDALQRVFQFRNCRLRLDPESVAKRPMRPCLLYHIRRCSAPCAAKVTQQQYAQQIRDFKRFMRGGRRAVLVSLRKRMNAAAKALRFEEAARLRDQIHALTKLAHILKDSDAEQIHIEPSEALVRLRDVLGLPSLPRLIEGVDVATLQGADAVGSVVTFVDGRPFKEGYRRYRIKRANRMNDPAMIGEVVYRRFRRKKEEDAPVPDILLVDGGKGQLSAAWKALDRVGIQPGLLVGLAKGDETIYIWGKREPLALDRTDLALRILQFVRDEAHRFVQVYHKRLRKKRTLGR